MKWLGLILTFLFEKMTSHGPSLKDSAVAIFEELTYKSRKTMSLILAGFASIIFLCGGFFISLIDATGQFDREGSIRMTSTFIAGLLLVAIAVFVFAWIFGSAWPGVKEHAVHAEDTASRAGAGSPLELALSALLMDFVKEREFKRENVEAQRSHPHPAPPPPSKKPREKPPEREPSHLPH